MLYTVNTASQTLLSGANVTFDANPVLTGCTATHTVGSMSVNLNKPGYYMIHFNADAVEGGTAGNVTMQLYANGAIVAGAEATANSAADTTIVNIGFTAIVRVLPNCCALTTNVPTTLTVQNAGVGAAVSNAAMTVTKIA